eukprot:TRINITY_DN7544_c0_g1_i7.p1 TRINITY_DN7544_c0_g1~~TRINITY_DN7544_c0_g1_i7.p1  ORF type:complete len:133 (-),score=10.50 TRINITY_DN7544_c0_g1_i7:1159-1557(-)
MKELYSEQSNLAGIHDCTNKVKFNTRGLVRDRILHKTARNKAWIFLLGHVVFCCLKDAEEQKKLLEQYRCWGLVRDRILHKTARNKAWIFHCKDYGKNFHTWACSFLLFKGCRGTKENVRAIQVFGLLTNLN